MAPAPTLLLVEDVDLDAEVVARLVRRLEPEIRIVRARNGEEALERLRGAGPEEPLPAASTVLLVDIHMPRMGGLALLKRVREDDALRHLPVFVLSSSRDPYDRRRAARHGARGFFVKPIGPEQLSGVAEAARSGGGVP